jgi:hypothetical protein
VSAPFESLLKHPALWRAGGSPFSRRGVVSSGYTELDSQLPGGGWPHPALIEVLNDRPGIGELSLLLPALRSLSETRAPILAWFNPPHLPYPLALVERGLGLARLLVSRPLADSHTLWAMEQALRSGTCAAVLAWAAATDPHALRRLKLAANEGGCLGFLFRSLRHRARPSPATVRLALTSESATLVVELLKVQGGRAATVRLRPN